MKKIFIFTCFIVVLYILYDALKNMDIQTNSYATKQEVITDKVIQRGWIPDILPNTAYGIVETHNIDTNEISGSFKYLEENEQELLNNLKRHGNKFIWEDFQIEIDGVKNEVRFYSKPQ